MAKRRTKKDRLHAKVHRVSSPSQARLAPTPKTETQMQAPVKFFSQDPRLIKTDLKRTLIVTLFILLVLFTIALLYT